MFELARNIANGTKHFSKKAKTQVQTGFSSGFSDGFACPLNVNLMMAGNSRQTFSCVR